MERTRKVLESIRLEFPEMMCFYSIFTAGRTEALSTFIFSQMESKETKKKVIKVKKVKKSGKDGEKLKRKKLFKCEVVKCWFVTDTSNDYTTDQLQVKHKSNGDLVLTLRDSSDDSVKYALPTRNDGFLVEQGEHRTNICAWIGTEKQYQKIGYLLIFETGEKASEFYKFTQQRNTFTKPIEEKK